MIKKIIIFLTLFSIFFASSWSLFRSDFFSVHDFTHGARIVEMHKALVDGHFPVRWSSDLGYGYGMPLFEFYAPLPYYVGTLFYFLGFSLVNSIKALFLISTLVTVIGSYKLGKTLFGSSWGLVVASAITLAPYRAVNLFVRGAISEAWGIMALPLILYGIIRVIEDKKENQAVKKNIFKQKRGWVILLTSLLILMLSHNLTTLIFLPLSVVFGAVYLFIFISSVKKKHRSKIFITKLIALMSTYFLSVMIASFYLLPTLIEKNYTRIESAIVGEYFDYNLHFLYVHQFFQVNWKYGGSTWGPLDDISFYLGTGQLIALGLSLFLFTKYLSKIFGKEVKKISGLKKVTVSRVFREILTKLPKKKIILYLTSFILLGFSIFMSIYKSKFIWDKLEFLSFIQFPWRWLSAVIIFLGLSIGFSSKFINSKFHRHLFSGVIVLLTIFSSWKFFQPEKYYSDISFLYYADRDKIRRDMSETLPDFIPIQMKGVVIDPVAQVDDLLGCEVEQRLEIVNSLKDQQQVDCDFEFNKLVDKTQKKLVEVNLPPSSKETLLEFAVADFPGWTAKVDGVIVQHKVSEFGTILVPVGEGKHLVGLEFKNSRIRLVADLISIFGLVIFLSIFFWYHGDYD